MIVFLIINFLLLQNLSIHLSIPKKVYYEEENVKICLSIKNLCDKSKKIRIPYLQPFEKKNIFVGEDAVLEVKVNGKKLDNFTNHMVPEPKPGVKDIVIGPKKEILWEIPFPYYYYPIGLPSNFEVKLLWNGLSSNTVSFRVLPSEGKREGENILINGDFSQGKDFPYGWKIESKNVFWEKEKKKLKYILDKKIASGEGLWIYSIFYPVSSPSSYLLKVRTKSSAPEIIVFVEGWGIVKGRKRRIERNECFLHLKDNKWRTFTFKIKFSNPSVKWIRVKPYAYLKPGTVYFDSIEILPLRND